MMVWEKNSADLAVTLEPEEIEDAQDVGDNTDDKYIKTEMPLTD